MPLYDEQAALEERLAALYERWEKESTLLEAINAGGKQ